MNGFKKGFIIGGIMAVAVAIVYGTDMMGNKNMNKGMQKMGRNLMKGSYHFMRNAKKAFM